MSPSAPDFVPDRLKEFRDMGMPELVKEVVDAFLAAALTQVTEIVKAASAGDSANAARIAHSLKSGAAGVGAQRVSGLCQVIEMQGKAGKIAEAAPAVQELSGALAVVIPILQKERG